MIPKKEDVAAAERKRVEILQKDAGP